MVLKDYTMVLPEVSRDQMVSSRMGGAEAYACKNGWGLRMMGACWKGPLEIETTQMLYTCHGHYTPNTGNFKTITVIRSLGCNNKVLTLEFDFIKALHRNEKEIQFHYCTFCSFCCKTPVMRVHFPSLLVL
jgi:hypothetical protein